MNLDSTGTRLWKCGSTMQLVADISESLTGTRAAAWEEQDTEVVDCLLDFAGIFPLFPMVAVYMDPQ